MNNNLGDRKCWKSNVLKIKDTQTNKRISIKMREQIFGDGQMMIFCKMNQINSTKTF